MRSPGSEETACKAAATIDAWRRRGDHRRDPIRFRFIETMARRAEGLDGEARRVLDERVAGLLADYAAKLAEAARDDAPAAPLPTKPEPGPLAALAARLGGPATPGADRVPAVDELRTLKRFRSTWSKLSADRRLTQSLAKVPQNAGPLNSHQLVHRSLTLMRDVSPEYLGRFMGYVDTLLWMEQLGTAMAPAAPDAGRRESGRAGRSASGKK